jgi:excisionase family DNA binding protein
VADARGDLLTLQEAADHLKVHYMTAYRWVRAGDLPAFKAGGRLRVRLADIEQFMAQRAVDVVLPHRGRTQWATHVDRLYGLLTQGHAAEAFQLVRKVIADGAPAGQVYLELLTPTLHRIGDAWATGEISVADEHRAAEICVAMIARLGDSFRRRGPARGTVVTLTPPDEHHGIGSAMAADFLRAGGFDVHHLGVNVPLPDLRRFLWSQPCDVICVSMTNPHADEAVYSAFGELAREHGVGLAFGGQGVVAQAAVDAGGIVITHLEQIATQLEELVAASA